MNTPLEDGTEADAKAKAPTHRPRPVWTGTVEDTTLSTPARPNSRRYDRVRRPGGNTMNTRAVVEAPGAPTGFGRGPGRFHPADDAA